MTVITKGYLHHLGALKYDDSFRYANVDICPSGGQLGLSKTLEKLDKDPVKRN